MSAPATRLSLRGRRLLWLTIAAGTLARLLVAILADTNTEDLASFAIVRDALKSDALDFYSAVPDLRWPYPPGYLPAVAGFAGVASATGIDFLHLLRLGPIATDVGIALLVQHLLGMRGASEHIRLAAAASVALGPVFVGVAGYQGQIDSVAILPALAAFVVWERGGPRRAVHAGLLLGLGGSVKTVPLLLVLALLPSVRSPREAATLLAAAAAVPLALIAPFLAHDPGAVWDHLTYRGFPGLGGLSLLVQPDLALFWQAGHDYSPNAATDALIDGGGVVVAAGLIATAALLARTRPEPLGAATIVWLAVWLIGVNFFIQYLIWGLPFLLARGELRAAAAIQALAGPALLLLYLDVSSEAAIWAVYTVPMLALWALWAALLAQRVRRYSAAMPGATPA
ncbi:MAG TPA: glycosyltransferase 87 family protein [Thermoleophilaceae bacterium]